MRLLPEKENKANCTFYTNWNHFCTWHEEISQW